MKSLGQMLRKHIDENGYTIYKAAYKANVNRTTLQKVLTDDRSASEELLKKLLPILKLSPDEDMEIWKTFEILQTGEATYEQRQYIKRMIESVANLDLFIHSHSHSHAPVLASASDEAEGKKMEKMDLPPLPIKGLYNVKHLLSSLLSKECQISAGSLTYRQILISAPGNLPILGQLLVHNLPHCRNLNKILLRHITPLIKSPGNSLTPQINLDILTNVLPFAISQAFHYEVYSFYRNELLADPFHYTFPYFIIFSHAVILLSLDGHAALPLTEPETIAYYKDLFHASLKKSLPLITACTAPEELMELPPAGSQGSRFAIDYQPCLTPFLTEDLIKKYTRSDIPGREEFIQAALRKAHRLSGMNHSFCIFSKAGLMDFALDGACSELPSRYARALDIPDRIQLLKSLSFACKKDKAFLRLVNPVTLSLPKHLSFVMREEYGIAFSHYDSQGTRFQQIRITEPSILEAFEDFYDYLCKSNLVYTKEDTLKEIEYLITGLLDKLV